MCNAYSITHPREAILEIADGLAGQLDLPLDQSGLPADLMPRYRISPRQWAPILYVADDHLVLTMALWGFLTKGAKPGFAPTNARDDKLTSGWPWKMVSKSQRCLVPADGFFEPEKPAGAKGTVPWSYYAMGNRQIFMMAGLWNRASDLKTGEPVDTYTIVTTSTSAVIRIHDRMPAIVEEDQMRSWLMPGTVPSELLKPYPAERMTGWRVTDEARNSRLPDHAGMVEPVG